MLVDWCYTDSTRDRVCLPGMALHQGYYCALDKCVALLHALWLCYGPTESNLRDLFSKVRSITTDGGAELHLLDVPDVLKCFLRRLDGAPLVSMANSVDPDTRLFGRAIGISGICHMVSQEMLFCSEYLARDRNAS